MLSRSFAAGLLILSLGPALQSARAQQAAMTTATTTTSTTNTAKKTTQPAAKSHKKARKTAPEPVVEAPPPPPPTPEHSPAGNPVVSYQNGQLTIHSENSTLGSILDAIKNSTGATVDGPGVGSPDRVATQIGPGDPRDVLTTLLNSSKYDFILVGPPENPTSVQKIILTARANGGAGGSAPQVPVGNQNRPPVQSFQPPPAAPQEPEEQLPDAEIPDDANQPEMPPPTEPDQGQQPPNGLPGQQPENGQPANPNQPKSPEQLLQELQRMQQQQQQIQQQQPQDR